MKGFNNYDSAQVRKQFMKNKKLLIIASFALALILLIAIHGYVKEMDRKERNYCVLKLSDDGSYYIVTGYEGKASNIVIPSKYKGKPVEVIGAWAFESIEFVVTSVVISDSVKIIEESAFEWMPYLTNVVIGRSVTEIGNKAFASCPALKSVTFKSQNSLKTIGDYAFFDSTITSISIPSSVTNMGRSVFASCDFLESATIPGSIQTMGINIFYVCSSLKSVTLAEGLPMITTGMFEGCTQLTKLVIPSSVTRIDRDAFVDSNLLVIYCKVNEKPDGWNDEWNSSNNEVVWGYVGD